MTWEGGEFVGTFTNDEFDEGKLIWKENGVEIASYTGKFVDG